jgi:hypothetical protein
MMRLTHGRHARRSGSLIVRSLLLPAAAVWLTGCADVTAPAASNAAVQASAEAMFNPQPDPPLELLYFVVDNPNLLVDPRGGEAGRLLDDLGRDAGQIMVIAIEPARADGQTLHLRLRWEFITDGTSLPAILPAVQVAGILNLSSGLLVLNGVADDGRRVHVRGKANGGPGALFGELMFNPQPDPPREG